MSRLQLNKLLNFSIVFLILSSCQSDSLENLDGLDKYGEKIESRAIHLDDGKVRNGVFIKRDGDLNRDSYEVFDLDKGKGRKIANIPLGWYNGDMFDFDNGRLLLVDRNKPNLYEVKAGKLELLTYAENWEPGFSDFLHLNGQTFYFLGISGWLITDEFVGELPSPNLKKTISSYLKSKFLFASGNPIYATSPGSGSDLIITRIKRDSLTFKWESTIPGFEERNISSEVFMLEKDESIVVSFGNQVVDVDKATGNLLHSYKVAGDIIGIKSRESKLYAFVRGANNKQKLSIFELKPDGQKKRMFSRNVFEEPNGDARVYKVSGNFFVINGDFVYMFDHLNKIKKKYFLTDDESYKRQFYTDLITGEDHLLIYSDGSN